MCCWERCVLFSGRANNNKRLQPLFEIVASLGVHQAKPKSLRLRTMLPVQEMTAVKVQYEARLKLVVTDYFTKLEITEPPIYLYHFKVGLGLVVVGVLGLTSWIFFGCTHDHGLGWGHTAGHGQGFGVKLRVTELPPSWKILVLVCKEYWGLGHMVGLVGRRSEL
jgi:hypothetical protein